MFKTIYTVRKIRGESTEYRAYFEEYNDAKKFAEKEAATIDDCFSIGQRHHLDGSFEYSWTGHHSEVLMNDFAWLCDYNCKGIRFYDDQGLVWNYDNYAQFKNEKLKKS